MSNYNPQGGGLQYQGTRALAPPNCFFETRDPTIFDTQGFSLLDEWLNTVTNQWFKLVDLKGSETYKRSIASWTLISSSMGDILTVTGDTGGPIGADLK